MFEFEKPKTREETIKKAYGKVPAYIVQQIYDAGFGEKARIIKNWKIEKQYYKLSDPQYSALFDIYHKLETAAHGNTVKSLVAHGFIKEDLTLNQYGVAAIHFWASNGRKVNPLKPYQRAIFDKISKSENITIALEKGAGKTGVIND
jgi:hypothetical protein